MCAQSMNTSDAFDNVRQAIFDAWYVDYLPILFSNPDEPEGFNNEEGITVN
jgi:hypothetical protein